MARPIAPRPTPVPVAAGIPTAAGGSRPTAADPANAAAPSSNRAAPGAALPGPDRPTVAPRRIGKYLIRTRLIRTDYSSVFLCRDPDLLIDVAVKAYLPTPEIARERTYGGAFWRERFIKEARILATIDHPHVIAVKELTIPRNGAPYFVMPFIEANLIYEIGRDTSDSQKIAGLPENKRPRRLALPRALHLLRQILSGLAELHRRGWVHRDIKPGNVLLTRKVEGAVKLCDFGMIKTPDSKNSRAGVWVGSRDYMAPEQRESAKDVDARADIYSVGALAYRLLTGHLPIGAFPAPDEANPEVPEPLSRLILQALAPDRAARPANAAAVLRLLRAIAPEANSDPAN